MTNQKGLIQLLVFLPILLLIFCVSGAWILLLKDFKSQQFHCRQILIVSQNILGKSMHDLMQLNDQAELLRYKEKEIKQMIAVVPDASKTVLLIKLQHILMQQKALRIRQELIKKTGRIKAQQELLKNRQFGITFSNIQYALVADPITAISPSYKKDTLFSQKQKMSGEWSQNPEMSWPKWMRHWLPSLPTWNSRCSITIIGGSKWDVIPEMDKS